MFLLKMSFPFISSSKYISCNIASWHIVDETQNFFNNCGKIEVIMVIKKFKSAITYFNVMISSFSPELPLVRRQMRGVGWVQGKSRDPFLAGTRLKFPNIYDLEHQSWFKKLKKGAGCNSMLYYLKDLWPSHENEKQFLNLNLNF